MTKTTAKKELMADFDLAQQAFIDSYARLRQTLRDTEAGAQPVQSLKETLKQHLTAASCLLAMGRATRAFQRRQHVAA
jgi:hypothetical protein